MAEKNNKFPEIIQADIDWLSAPPKWYKHYLDANKKDPLQRVKVVVMANFPAVTNIQAFHEIQSDIGWNMIFSLLVNWKPISINVTNQQIMNRLNSLEVQDLWATVKDMTVFERAVFNTLVSAVKFLEKKKEPIKWNIKKAFVDLDNEIQTA
jgi:hypothetical protein